jgi:uncharacterized protein YunC (DUF1805 family)
MKLYSGTITGSLTVNGNITVNGSSSMSSSQAVSSSYALSSSYSQTSSYANTFTVASTLTAQTLVVQTITTSIDYITGSAKFGSSLSSTFDFTGSVRITGSLNASGAMNLNGALTATSLSGTINGSNLVASSVSNSALATSTISGIALGSNLATLTIGTGLSGTSYNGSGAVTIANSGVLSITTNTGLSTNASATGNVTITNTGVTSNVAGTGVSVSGATGAVTISIGQSVATSASPTFAGLALGDGVYLYSDTNRDPSAAAYYPNAWARGFRFSFANASSLGTGGNYGGVLHFHPWDGTTSSTGDASYQLAFGSTATNGGGNPQLRIRKGIDTTWNSWYDVITSANISTQTVASAGNATTAGGYAVETGRNNNASKIVTTDTNGYIQCGYINSSNGNENNNSNADRVWGTNGSDNYLRTYRTSALSVSYAATAGSAPANGGTSTYATYLNPLSGDGNYKLAYTADGARTNAGEWGRAVMYYVPNGQTYGIRVDRADYANSAGSITSQANSATITATSGNTANQIVQRDGNGDIAIGTLNANYAYFGSGGRGLTSPDAQGSSYGNICTYGTGVNAWNGYAIYDTSGQYSAFMSNGGNYGIYAQSGGKWAFYFSVATQSWSIGSSNAVSGYTLYLIYGLYTTSLYNSSDATKKKNIVSLTNCLDKVKALRPVSFEYIDKGDGTFHQRTELGFIAQEVEPILPDLVDYSEKNGYGMNYLGMTAVLTEAMKEQQTQIESQQAQIDTLTAQLNQLLNK